MKPVVLLIALLFLAASGPVVFAKRSSSTTEQSKEVSAPAKSTAPAPKLHIDKQPRNVPSSVKGEVYKESGIPKADQKNYVIDHKVPLELGGSNSRSNLQAQPKSAAKNKDRWENYLTGQVQAGKMTVGQAQAEIQRPHSGPPPM